MNIIILKPKGKPINNTQKIIGFDKFECDEMAYQSGQIIIISKGKYRINKNKVRVIDVLTKLKPKEKVKQIVTIEIQESKFPSLDFTGVK